jgi:hypothetical protein
MSINTTENPISFPYIIQHVLAAFKTTSGAEGETLGEDSGGSWEKIGDGVVILNDMDDKSLYSLSSLTTTWSKYGLTGRHSTSMTGSLIISDSTGGRFLTDFRKYVLQKLERSSKHLTF